MDSLPILQRPLRLSLNHFPSFPKPISSLCFKTHLPSSNSPSISMKTSSVSLNPISSSVLKTTSITIAAAAAAALFFARFCGKPAIAAPVPPATVEALVDGEAQLVNNANDIEALRSLIEVKVKAKNFPEAIDILNRLIELEPNDLEWLVLKANIYNHMGDSELARNEFERVLVKDPFLVEAYHGLVMLIETSDSDSLKGILKRVEGVMENCKKEKGKSEERDFKLLIAQIKVMEGSYSEALDVYQELEKEEPRDFRPYLCQGILYTLLRKNDEAKKQFEIFRRLVPKNHPYKEYFDDNMFATKHFVQQIEEAAGSKN